VSTWEGCSGMSLTHFMLLYAGLMVALGAVTVAH
jgi:hypothetical protein